MGAAWFELTALPFVYAVWALRRGQENSSLRRFLSEAREFGLDTLDYIIRNRTEYTEDFRKDYFGWHIHYHLGADEKRGLTKFIELLKKHNLGTYYLAPGLFRRNGMKANGLILFLRFVFRLFFFGGDDFACDGVDIHFGDVARIRRGNIKGPDEFAVLFFEFGFFDGAAGRLGEGGRLRVGLGDFGLGHPLRLFRSLVLVLFFFRSAAREQKRGERDTGQVFDFHRCWLTNVCSEVINHSKMNAR